MTFRSIGDLAIEVLAEMNATGEQASAMDSAQPAAVEFVAAAHLSGGEENSRLCAGGNAQTGMGKRTGANPGQVGGGNVEQRTEADWRLITTRLRTIHRRNRIAMPQRHAPAVAMRFRLVMDSAHQNAPRARRMP